MFLKDCENMSMLKREGSLIVNQEKFTLKKYIE
jgi:hypothetical protein